MGSDYSYKITMAAQQSLTHIEGKVAELGRRVSVINKKISDLEMERQAFLEALALYEDKAASIKSEGLR